MLPSWVVCGRQEGFFICDWQARQLEQFKCKCGQQEGLSFCDLQEKGIVPVISCNSCSFCKRVATKQRCKSRHCSTSRNKICEICFLCRSLEFCPKCHNCCSRSACRGQIASILGKMGSPGVQSKSHNSPQRRLHPSLPNSAKSDKFTHRHKLLYKSAQEQLPDRGIACTFAKNAAEPVTTQKSLRFYNRLFLVPKPNNWWRPILDFTTLNKF